MKNVSTIAIDARIINSSTGRYIERLLYYLEQIDDQHDYVILVPSKDLDYFQPTNPRWRVVPADFASYSWGEQWGFLRLLNELAPDLVHFCMPQQPILYRGRHVTTIHDLILLQTYNSDKNYVVFKLKQLVGRAVFKIIGKTSAHIITPSQFTRDAYARYARVPADKITVTYEDGRTAAATPLAYSYLTNSEYILYVGGQSDYKNIRRLMQAHQLLRQKFPALQLVLVGRLSGKNGVPLQKNKQWAGEQGYEGIIYTDFLPDEQLVWVYKHALTYVFPSLMEGFGLPGLEALNAGVPLVSSNATCLPEIYGDAAVYFDPTNVIAMASAIERVLGDKTLRTELIKKGHQRAKKYSWRHMAEQTLAVYEQALNEK